MAPIPGGTFIGDLTLRRVSGIFLLDEPFLYVDSAGVEHRVEKDTPTDLASIPAVARMLFDPTDDHWIQGAVLHDDLYARHGVSRARADAILAEIVAYLGGRWWQRWAIWLGVRLGGYFAYRSGPRRRADLLHQLRLTGEF